MDDLTPTFHIPTSEAEVQQDPNYQQPLATTLQQAAAQTSEPPVGNIIGGQSQTIGAGADVQAALTALSNAGGGTLYMKAGSYSLSTDITIPSGIEIIGDGPTATVINFGAGAHAFKTVGTGIYTTGTISAISGTAVTGSGTAWSTNVTPGQQIFIGTRWYLIAAVGSDTSITLAESYGDNVTLPASYRIATIATDLALKNLGITNASGSPLTLRDVRRLIIDNIQVYGNGQGPTFQNISEFKGTTSDSVGNGGAGITMTDCGLGSFDTFNAAGNTGNGLTISNVKVFAFSQCAFDANSSDGVNVTTGVQLHFFVDASGNGGSGINLVSGCDRIRIYNTDATGNTSDGVKCTASATDTHIFGGGFVGNGRYGINIVDTTTQDTVITTNNFAGNVSAAINDAGTGTLIRANTGVSDNSTSSLMNTALTFTTTEALTANDAVAIGGYQSDGGVTYDTAATNTAAASAGVATITNPITVGSNSNRILIAAITSTSPAPSVTWAGTPMTQIDNLRQSSSGQYLTTFYLLAPTTGANNLVVSGLSGSEGIRYFVYSYYNAKQSAQPDGHSITGGTTNVSTTLTPTTDGCLLWGLSYDQDAALTVQSGTPNNQKVATGYVAGDNGAIMPQALQTVNGQGASTNRIICTAISITPVTAPIYGVQRASSAANDTRSKAFIGFVSASYAAGATATVYTGGEITFLSGLTPTYQYYLNDTNGSIGTSVGTVTRKVGIAIDTTSLLITNIW